MNRAFVIAVLVSMAVVSGCASSPPVTSDSNDSSLEATPGDSTGSPADHDQVATNHDAIQEHRVQPGYLYEISNINDNGLNGKYRVDFDGKLRLTYGVVIDTTNLDEADVRAKIIEAYRPFLKSADSIRVTVIQKKLWVDIRGLVNKAGRYLVEPDASLDEVLNSAGSIVQNSQAEYLKIQKKSGVVAVSLTEYYDTGNANGIPRWEGGEILFVQRKSEVSSSLITASHPVVQVLGEVKTPGEIAFRRDGDFLYYLTKAGGPSSVANLGKIEVIRWQDGKRKSTVYDWDQSRQLVQLESGDLIIVHATQQTPLERTIQSAAGVGAVLSAIGILIIAL
jgi:protein involved in polysaccharide export with SLBB domain